MKHLAAVLLLCATACATGESAQRLNPATSRLAPWTTQLREQQPKDAFAAVYRVGKTHLIFVGALHENETDSATFQMIRDAYAVFDIDTVIAEGVPTSSGPNPQSLMNYGSEEARNGFQEGGESVPTVVGALKDGAQVWGGEPDDPDVKARVIAQGFSPEDVLGYYVLRVIPQWERERKIENAGDPRLRLLVEEQLRWARGALKIDDTVLPGFDRWANWYQASNGKPITSGLAIEEVGPLHDGSYRTNKVAAAVSRARDTFLHELIVKHLKARKTVLVVFGGSHLMIQRPALDAALGSPCHAGESLKYAPGRCG